MNHFDAVTVYRSVRGLQEVASRLVVAKLAVDSVAIEVGSILNKRPAAPLMSASGEMSNLSMGLLKEAKDACKQAHFADAEVEISEILAHIGDGSTQDYSSLQVELIHAAEAIGRELTKRRFLYIRQERSTYVDNAALMGTEVAHAFPSAISDIKDAGNCLAAECNTAAVFHLMRTVEWGLRALCVNLGFKRCKSKIRRSGRVTYAPIEYAEWEKILDEAQSKVDDKISRLRRGHKKQENQEFYYSALQDIKAIRDAWRNHVMHTRAEYGHEDADAILGHVRRVMSALAKRISEV